MTKTKSGLTENLASALAYSFGLVTGIIFLVLESSNKKVRFHALQSIAFCLVAFLGNLVFSLFPLTRAFIAPLWGLLIFVLWLVLMIKAYQGQKFNLPLITDWVKTQNK